MPLTSHLDLVYNKRKEIATLRYDLSYPNIQSQNKSYKLNTRYSYSVDHSLSQITCPGICLFYICLKSSLRQSISIRSMSANSSSTPKKELVKKITFQRLQYKIVSTNIYVSFCKNIFYIMLQMKLQYHLNSETSVCSPTLAIISICTTFYKDNCMQSGKGYTCNSCPVKFHFSVCFRSNIKPFFLRGYGQRIFSNQHASTFHMYFLIIQSCNNE